MAIDQENRTARSTSPQLAIADLSYPDNAPWRANKNAESAKNFLEFKELERIAHDPLLGRRNSLLVHHVHLMDPEMADTAVLPDEKSAYVCRCIDTVLNTTNAKLRLDYLDPSQKEVLRALAFEIEDEMDDLARRSHNIVGSCLPEDQEAYDNTCRASIVEKAVAAEKIFTNVAHGSWKLNLLPGVLERFYRVKLTHDDAIQLLAQEMNARATLPNLFLFPDSRGSEVPLAVKVGYPKHPEEIQAEDEPIINLLRLLTP